MAYTGDPNARRLYFLGQYRDLIRTIRDIGDPNPVMLGEIVALLSQVESELRETAGDTRPEVEAYASYLEALKDDLTQKRNTVRDAIDPSRMQQFGSLLRAAGGAAVGGVQYAWDSHKQTKDAQAAAKAAKTPKQSIFSTGEQPKPAETQPSKLTAFFFFLVFYIIMINLSVGSYMPALYASLVMLVWLLLSKQMKKEFIGFYGLFFVITLIVHIYFFQQGFAFSTSNIFLVAAVYIIFAVCTWLFAPDKKDALRTALLITVLTLAIYAMPPFLVKFLPAFWQQALIYAVAAAPIGVFYMLHRISMANEGGYADGLWFWYKVFGVAIPLIILLLTANFKLQALLPAYQVGGVDVKTGIGGFYNSLTESFKKVLTRGKGVYTQATDPGAYYTGEVEKNKKAPLGVKITSLRTADKTINNDTPVLIYGNVEATSFIGTSVQITPSCVIDRPGAPEAVVDPPGMEVLYGTGTSFQCTFPPLKTGTYTVQATASFPFETWAYIPYTFVDEERARNIAKQGQDIRDVLDIPAVPVATYTSGPVIIGMGGSEQPILVRPNADQVLQPGTRIGLTIDSAWDSGKLLYVDKVQLKVPRPFVLTDCDRKQLQGPQKDDKEPEEYTNYVFQNPTFDTTTTYSSITCKLTIPKSASADAARLVETEKATRSFIAVVHYQYAVHEQTTVNVR
jgi:hypothetical protein